MPAELANHLGERGFIANRHISQFRRSALLSALGNEGGTEQNDLGDEVEPNEHTDQRGERGKHRIPGGSG